MKTAGLLLALTLLSGTAPAHAQRPASPRPARPAPNTRSMSEPAPTPEMWFYQQELRRREDPRVAVREKAAFQAAQRQRRIAALKWFGYSNSRPVANPTPFCGPYSPAWTSNTFSPYQWSGQTGAAVIHSTRRPDAPMYGLW